MIWNRLVMVSLRLIAYCANVCWALPGGSRMRAENKYQLKGISMRMRSIFASAIGLTLAALVFMASPSMAAMPMEAEVYNADIACLDVMFVIGVSDKNMVQASARSPGGGTSCMGDGVTSIIKPIYAMSMQTNGQSLAGYHRRC